MPILVSTDDGIDSVGLHDLARALVDTASGATVAAKATAQVGSRCSLVARTWPEPAVGDDVDVVGGDEGGGRRDTDPPDPGPMLQIRQHHGQSGHIRGVAGERVMGDRDAVGGAQQPDAICGRSRRRSLE